MKGPAGSPFAPASHGLLFGRVTGRFILMSFLLLLLFVCVTLLSSTSKLSVIVDMSVKMKSDVLNVLNGVADFNLSTHSRDRINSTFSIRSLHSKQEVKRDYEKWRRLHERKEINDVTAATVIATEDLLTKVTKKVTNATSTTRESVTERAKVQIDVLGNHLNSTVSQRQAECESCFEHRFQYVISSDNICNVSNNERIDLIVLILTVHQNLKARNALRRTWLTYTGKNTKNVRYVFLLGETRDERLRKDVLEENEWSHDIVKENFVDSYKNLTYKTIMGFKWAATRCAHARFVLKTDDDMYVNIPNLLKRLNTLGEERLKKTVIGACNKKSSPIRNKKSKWFASADSYPERFYPGFCSGTGYATSLSLARDVYRVSPHVPFFHLEDVYVSLCVKKLGYSLLNVPGFNPGRPKLDPCVYKGDVLITAHQFSPVMLAVIWSRQCHRHRPDGQAGLHGHSQTRT